MAGVMKALLSACGAARSALRIVIMPANVVRLQASLLPRYKRASRPETIGAGVSAAPDALTR